jgi:hypothetical protein
MFLGGGPQHNLTYIPAGAQHEWVWSGEIYASRAMPAQCYADPEQSLAEYGCPQVVPAKAGMHTVAVEVLRGATCTPAGGGDDCTCTPSSPGASCWLQADDLAFTSSATLSADFEVPADTTVTLLVP